MGVVEEGLERMGDGGGKEGRKRDGEEGKKFN